MTATPFSPGFWPALVPDLEDGFRRSRDVEERQIIFALGIIVAIATCSYLPTDFGLHGPPELYWILSLRGVMLAVAASMIATSRSSLDHDQRDLRAPLWFLGFVIADLGISAFRPIGYPGVLLMAPVVILGSYVALPIRPAHLAPLAIIESLGALTLSYTTKDFDGATMISHAIALAVANVVGVVAIRRIGTTDRRQFVALREAQEANQELEKAMAEIRTLRGIVPICSSCKKIRDDSGFWEAVEIYVSRHSPAKFSHGLCPTCLDVFLTDHRESSAGGRTGEESAAPTGEGPPDGG